jgi:hypothetical protein
VIGAVENGLPRERLHGITIIGWALLVAAAYLLVLAGLIVTGREPLVRGAYLLEGLEVRGAGAFVAAALAGLAAGMGLLHHCNWARRLACVLAVALMIGAVPAVSSAVVDFRFWTLLSEGMKLISGVVVCFYLAQPDTRAAFSR